MRTHHVLELDNHELMLVEKGVRRLLAESTDMEETQDLVALVEYVEVAKTVAS